MEKPRQKPIEDKEHDKSVESAKENIDQAYLDILEALKYPSWNPSYRSVLHQTLNKLNELKNTRL